MRVNKNEIECFHGDTETQRVPVKDSGIPWIGNIPEDWEIHRLKSVSSVFTGNSISDNDKNLYENLSVDSSIPYIATKDIERDSNRINYENGLRTLKSDSTFKIAPQNSTLLCIEGGSAGEKIALTNQNVSFVNKLCCFNGRFIEKKFIFYFLQSPAFKDCFKSFISGLIGGVSVSIIKNLPITIPPAGTQKRIADFLDKKCAEIDALIALQEKMIEELKSYKQSVITEAVTRGVPAKNQNKGSHGDTKPRSVAGTQNNTFPNQKSAELALERQRKTSLNSPCPRVSVRDKMKDSGIPWLGSIPAHWEVKRLKFSCSIQGRIGFRGYTSDDLVSEGEGAITLSPSNMKDMKMDFDKRTYLSWAKYYESPEIMIVPGDILFVKTGSTYGKCSFVDFVPMECTINPQIVVFKSHKDNPKFLSYYFQTPIANAFVETSVVGGTIPTISQEKIINYAFAIPPMDEQREITEYLDEKCSEIDTMISLKQQKIATLQNYKKSVIFEYVTGKKEV